jgi:hypothetical protein
MVLAEPWPPYIVRLVGRKYQKDAKSHTEDRNRKMASKDPRIMITGLACRVDRLLLVCSFSKPSSR